MDSEHLRDHFDRHAVDFDVLYHPKRQSSLGRWLNRRFRSDILGRYQAAIKHVQDSDAKSVLDVGCGPGHYLAALSKMGIPRLVGVDVSEQMIALARNHPEISRSSSIELIQADYLEWTADTKFDVILALGFFDYVQDPVPILRKMRSETTHSVFASFPSRHWLRMPFRWARRRLQGTKVYFYSEAQIRELAVESGYTKACVASLPGAGMNLVGIFS